jgi:hypothetical protein
VHLLYNHLSCTATLISDHNYRWPCSDEEKRQMKTPRKKRVAGEDQPVRILTSSLELLTNSLVDTAFKQQRLKAWQPILTPKTVLPTLFIIGIIFAPIGALLIWGNSLVRLIEFQVFNFNLDLSIGYRIDIRLHQLRLAHSFPIKHLFKFCQHA